MNNDHIRPEWIPSAYREGAKAAQENDIEPGDATRHPHKHKSTLGAPQASRVGSIKKKAKSQRRALRARR